VTRCEEQPWRVERVAAGKAFIQQSTSLIGRIQRAVVLQSFSNTYRLNERFKSRWARKGVDLFAVI
jgi:hypothetical protein